MSVYIAVSSKPRPGGLGETTRILQEYKPIATRHGAFVTAWRAMAAGPSTGMVLLSAWHESMTALGESLASMRLDPDSLALQAEVQKVRGTAYDLLGTMFITDMIGYEQPIPQTAPDCSLTVVAYEPRPEQRDAMGEICASYFDLFKSRGQPVAVRSTLFSGAPQRILFHRYYDGGVAELWKAWDASRTDPEIQAWIKKVAAAGIAPVSMSTWSRIAL
jgi:hypothetical protein